MLVRENIEFKRGNQNIRKSLNIGIWKNKNENSYIKIPKQPNYNNEHLHFNQILKLVNEGVDIRLYLNDINYLNEVYKSYIIQPFCQNHILDNVEDDQSVFNLSKIDKNKIYYHTLSNTRGRYADIHSIRNEYPFFLKNNIQVELVPYSADTGKIILEDPKIDSAKLAKLDKLFLRNKYNDYYLKTHRSLSSAKTIEILNFLEKL